MSTGGALAVVMQRPEYKGKQNTDEDRHWNWADHVSEYPVPQRTHQECHGNSQ